MENYEKLFKSNAHANFKYAKGEVDIYTNMFHDCYEIYLLLDGNVEFVNNHSRYTLLPYQLVVIPMGEYHQFIVNDSMDTYERCVINLYPELFHDDTLSAALSGKELLTLPKDHRIIENMLYLKKAMHEYSDADFSHVLSAIATDIVLLVKHLEHATVTTHSQLHPLALQIMNYVNERYQDNISLEDIARHCYISVSSVSHIFKNNFGISIKKYIIEKRMTEAKFCLNQGEKAQEVCHKFGFANYSTFYRAYKEYFGHAPSKRM